MEGYNLANRLVIHDFSTKKFSWAHMTYFWRSYFDAGNVEKSTSKGPGRRGQQGP